MANWTTFEEIEVQSISFPPNQNTTSNLLSVALNVLSTYLTSALILINIICPQILFAFSMLFYKFIRHGKYFANAPQNDHRTPGH